MLLPTGIEIALLKCIKNLSLKISLLFVADAPFRWLDGTNLMYTKWAPGEPNDKVGEIPQLCNEMYVNLFPGFWNDHWCTEYRSYVCQARMGKSFSRC